MLKEADEEEGQSGRCTVTSTIFISESPTMLHLDVIDQHTYPITIVKSSRQLFVSEQHHIQLRSFIHSFIHSFRTNKMSHIKRQDEEAYMLGRNYLASGRLASSFLRALTHIVLHASWITDFALPENQDPTFRQTRLDSLVRIAPEFCNP